MIDVIMDHSGNNLYSVSGEWTWWKACSGVHIVIESLFPYITALYLVFYFWCLIIKLCKITLVLAFVIKQSNLLKGVNVVSFIIINLKG